MQKQLKQFLFSLIILFGVLFFAFAKHTHVFHEELMRNYINEPTQENLNCTLWYINGIFKHMSIREVENFNQFIYTLHNNKEVEAIKEIFKSHTLISNEMSDFLSKHYSNIEHIKAIIEEKNKN